MDIDEKVEFVYACNLPFSIVEQFTYTYDSSPPVGVLVDDRRNTTSVKMSW